MPGIDVLELRQARHSFNHEACTGTAMGRGTTLIFTLPVAGVMLFGGFAGRGFVRCWCLGCLAVCLWYEGLRLPPVPSGAAAPAQAR